MDSDDVTLNYIGHANVPVRFLAEHMGAVVGYDENTRTIKVNYNTDSTQIVKTDSYALAVPKNLDSRRASGQCLFLLQWKRNWRVGD